MDEGVWRSLFHPRAIAVVGASANPQSQGYRYVRHLLDYGYRGEIYPVNPRLEELLGLRAYPSLSAVPGPVDYVIVCVPAPLVPQVAEEAVAKGARALQLFTARFSETGRREGLLLEQELLRRAKGGGLRILGPNCMGIYCPRSGLSFADGLPREAGPAAFFAQSGGNSVQAIWAAAQRGVRFSKAISYGNALDINEADLLEYLAQDPETGVIGAYIEGVRDGRRFFQALKGACARKPVVILKGGLTEAGARAALSHTASLAGASQVWRAAMTQAGAIQAESMEELVDLLVSFALLPPARGRRVGIIGGGGARSVLTADRCEEAGLIVAPLPEEFRHILREEAPTVWDWVGNPVDVSIFGEEGPAVIGHLLQLMLQDPRFDALIADVTEHWWLTQVGGEEGLRQVVRGYIKVGRGGPKPLAIILGSAHSRDEGQRRAVEEAREELVEAGLAVYPTLERAVKALARFLQYHQDGGPGQG